MTPEELKSARDRVVAAFPDSVRNPGDANVRWELDLTGLLGFCGCGEPNETARWLAAYLRAMRDSDHNERARLLRLAAQETLDDDNGMSGPLFWLMSYWADERFRLEHGTSIRFSWPDHGKLSEFDAMLSALDLMADAPEPD